MAEDTPTYDEKKLLEKLAVDPNLVQNDLHQAVAYAQQISSPSSLGRALTLLEDRLFQSFYNSDTSSMLLANGHMELDPEHEATSPLTYISGIVYNTLAQHPNILRLFHLCGQHMAFNDTYRGLAGTIRCLNAGLLSDNQHVTPFCFEEEFVNNLVSNDVKSLSELLYMLVSTSARPSIFILIDGITIVEGSTPSEHFNIFVRGLWQLINELNINKQRNLRGPVLKVLFMSPTRSIRLEPLLRNLSLNLPEDDYFMAESYEVKYHEYINPRRIRG